MIRVDNSGSSSALIQVRGLNKTYRRGGEEIQVLQGLNLDVDKGDFVGFMGPSGSGKTTLLNLMGGLDVPTAGTISVAGDEITHMSSGKLTEWRAPRQSCILKRVCWWRRPSPSTASSWEVGHEVLAAHQGQFVPQKSASAPHPRVLHGGNVSLCLSRSGERGLHQDGGNRQRRPP